MPNSFTETYRSFSTVELLEILQYPDQYQPQAIIAAKEEITNRQLDQQQMNEAQVALEQKQEREMLLQQQQSRLKNTVRQYGLAVINDITPAQTEMDLGKKIRLLCYGLIVIIVYNSFKVYNNIEWIFRRKIFDFIQILQVILHFMLIIGVIQFWRRKKAGWVLLTCFATFTALDAIVGFAAQLMFRVETNHLFDISSRRLVNYFVAVLIYIGMMYFLNKRDMKHYYSISKKTSNLSIIITSLFMFVYILILSRF